MTSTSTSPVIVCSTEQEYHDAINNAGDKLVVVDCYADWYVFAMISSYVLLPQLVVSLLCRIQFFVVISICLTIVVPSSIFFLSQKKKVWSMSTDGTNI